MADNPFGLPDMTWLGGGTQAPNYNTMGMYGSGIPYNQEHGGFGAFPNSGQVASQGDTPGILQNISQGLGAFTSLAQVYGMFQNLGLQKKAFKFAQTGTKNNFNAQATAFNNAVDDQHAARSAYAAANNGSYDSMQDYGSRKVDKWT